MANANANATAARPPGRPTAAAAAGEGTRRERRHAPRPKQRRRPRTHRAYGLPNANQIFLTLVIVALLFIELLRPDWLEFGESDATAGLASIRLLSSKNDSTVNVAWRDFCDPSGYNYTLPIDTTVYPPLAQPFDTRDDAVRACHSNTPETVRVLTAMGIACSMLSGIVALYFHLGTPTQRQVVWLGVVPGVMLLATGALGTIALTVWQYNFGPLDNGDCFRVAIASTVIAYVVAISMAIRWRWPGIFAVDDEQQAFEVRRNWRRRPPPSTTTASTTDEGTPTINDTDSPQTHHSAFHQVV